MKYYELELDNEVYQLRLTVNNAIELEEKNHTKLLDYIEDYSIKSVTTLLMYFVRGSRENFSKNQATELMNKLLEKFSFEEVISNVIYEVLVVSGFLKKEQVEQTRELKQQAQEKMIGKVTEVLETL